MNDTNTNSSYTSATDAAGKAVFAAVPAGVYEASATDKRYAGGSAYIYNGVKSSITVSDTWNAETAVKLDLTESETNQLVIKELYTGGCQKDDGSGAFYHDKYVILYNNSEAPVSLANVCLAMALPYNANSTSNADYVNEALYSNSINFANPDYYCTYDIEQYNNTLYYPVPSDAIPTSHHLKGINYGAGNAWPVSQVSPAFFLFSTPEGTSISSFVNEPSSTNYYNNSTTQVRKKVQNDWVIDGVEVFKSDATNNKKRLTAAVDAGYVNYTNQQGHTLYRNVDKEATEAIAGNDGKIVYTYSMGTDGEEYGTTDPSGIDAEASIKNGALVIYQDTNNSSKDFHQRKQSSLRD